MVFLYQTAKPNQEVENNKKENDDFISEPLLEPITSNPQATTRETTNQDGSFEPNFEEAPTTEQPISTSTSASTLLIPTDTSN